MHTIDPSHSNDLMQDFEAEQESLSRFVAGTLKGSLPLWGDTSQSSIQKSQEDQSTDVLSDMQYAYLLGSGGGLELGGIASSVYREVDLVDLDIARFENSLCETVRKHPMLRASLVESGKNIKISDEVTYKIPIDDLSVYDEESSKRIIQEMRSEMEITNSPYQSPTPFAIRISKISSRVMRLHIYIELLFLDAVSVDIFLRDWWSTYKNGQYSVSEVPEYSMYARAERNLQKTSQTDDDQIFWRRWLNALPSAPELPVKTAPQLIGRPKFRHIATPVPDTLLAQLRNVACASNLTLEAIMLGAYAEVIARWARHQAFTITVTEHGRRPHFDRVEDIIGNFLQPVPLPIRDMPERSLADRIARLQSALLSTRLHTACSTIQAMRDHGRRQSQERGLSTPVVFNNLLDAGLDFRVVGSASTWDGVAPGYASSRTPQVWLELQITRQAGTVWTHWNYVDELMPNGMVGAMANAFLDLLTVCATDPSALRRSGSIVALPHDDRVEREVANETGNALSLSLLHEMVLAAAARNPDKAAVRMGGRTLVFRDLERDATRLSARLRSICDIQRDDIIAVSLHQEPELIVAILAILMAGAAYVTIDPALPSQRRLSLLARCSAKAIITKSAIHTDETFTDCCPRVDMDAAFMLPEAFTLSDVARDLDDLAYVIFTSGSTGEPKGVMVSHRNAANTVLDINRRFNVSADDAVLSIAPPGFDLSVYDYFGVLGAGGCVVFPALEAANDPNGWIDAVISSDVTIWNSVPAPMKLVVDNHSDKLRRSKLRLLLLSGDWIPVDLPNGLRRALPSSSIISLGGATEGSIWSIYFKIVDIDPLWSSIPYGKPLSNQQFHVLNDWLDPCPKWVTGELYIGGLGVTRGYLGDPEKTAGRYIVHPLTLERLYKTGDLGRYIDDGNIEILGREDNQVKINGYRVELGEIEACIILNGNVRHAVVDAPFHPDTKRRHIVAYIVRTWTTTNVESVIAELKQGAKDSLPSYMVPNHYVFLDEIPLTPNGKIDRKALPSPLGRAPDVHSSVSEAKTDAERIILAMWRAQLERPSLGVGEGFFDAGGDSLHAVGILSAVREKFRVPPDGEQTMVEALFMNADVFKFAKIVEVFGRVSNAHDQ